MTGPSQASSPRPLERSSLSAQLFEQLRTQILAGQYAPGDRLPPERELCESFQVNRGSVREALKRLEQTRLIRIRQGDGSVVLDFRAHAGFDLLSHLVMPGGTLNPLALRSVLEFRALIGPEIARLAALRATPEHVEHLADLVTQIKQCEDNETFQQLDFEFYKVMARASENVAFLLVLNSITDVYAESRQHFASMFAKSTDSHQIYRRVQQAIKKGQTAAAARLCRELLDGGTVALASAEKKRHKPRTRKKRDDSLN